jgi:hypothetical protein
LSLAVTASEERFAMPSIFLSYSSLETKRADDMKRWLADLGYENVFLDFDKDTGFAAGEVWEPKLYENLSRCHAVILLLSPNWLKSTWCRNELAIARSIGKVVIPVICSPLGSDGILPELQAVDLVNWNADGLTRIEKRLRSITGELARGFKLHSDRPPFPGIHAFEAEDAAIYFGRDEEVRTVIEKFESLRLRSGPRMLLILGASGAGKSSLLKAGILPQLSRRRTQWLILPVLRPDRRPLRSFAKCLAQQVGKPEHWRSWYERLDNTGATLEIEHLIDDLRIGEARNGTVLIPIDQFEELFTISDAGERAVLSSLLAAICDPLRNLPAIVVATGRADVLQDMLETGPLATIVEPCLLSQMPLERIPSLIEGPAVVASLTIEDGLIGAIARDVQGPEALPLLAYTLQQLYARSPDKRLTLAVYESLGSDGLNPVHNAVRLGADEAIARCKASPSELAALREAFIPHLVRQRLEDKRYVRTPAPLKILPRDATRLIRALVEARLLTTRIDDEQPVVEAAHEALFTAWPALKAWLAEEQDFLADIERLKVACDTWLNASDARKSEALLHGLLLSRAREWLLKYPGRFAGFGDVLQRFIAASAIAADTEQANRRTLRRYVFAGMTIALVTLTVTSIVAGWQYIQADRARNDTEAQRQIAEKQTKVAVQRQLEADREREEASRQADEARKQEKLANQERESADEARREAEVRKIEAQRNLAIAKSGADDLAFHLATSLPALKNRKAQVLFEILESARTLIEPLANADPDDGQIQKSFFLILSQIIEPALTVRQFDRARSAAETCRNLAHRFSSSEEEANVCIEGAADLEFIVGNSSAAVDAYAKLYAASSKKLSKASDDFGNWAEEVYNTDGRLRNYTGLFSKAVQPAFRELSRLAIKLGNAFLSSGDQKKALVRFESVFEEVTDPLLVGPFLLVEDDVAALAHLGIGKIQFEQSNWAGALDSFQRSLADADQFSSNNDPSIEVQRAASEGIGDIKWLSGKWPDALNSYAKSYSLLKEVAALDQSNILDQSSLSAILIKLAGARLQAQDQKGAFSAYYESAKITGDLITRKENIEGLDARLKASIFGLVKIDNADPAVESEAYIYLKPFLAAYVAKSDAGDDGLKLPYAISLYYQELSRSNFAVNRRENLTEALQLAEQLKSQGQFSNRDRWLVKIRRALSEQ